MKHPIREKRAQKISNHDISIDMDQNCKKLKIHVEQKRYYTVIWTRAFWEYRDPIDMNGYLIVLICLLLCFMTNAN